MAQTLLTSLLLCGTLVASAQDALPPLDEVYYPLTPGDVSDIRAILARRDLSARSVEIVHEEPGDDFKLMLVGHQLAGRIHYGAIMVPLGDLTNSPVVVVATGLNQEYPALDLEKEIGNHRGDAPTASFIKVLPTFRGRTLNYRGMSFGSEGDFCDAYDGAADDAIAMLNVAAELIPEANFEKVLAYGASRGGNTALLMGVRDSRVNTIMAMASPTDFYWEPLRETNGEQFACQFLEGRSAQEARQLMIASSPIFFEMNESVEHVFLYHGSRDAVVPLWNSHEMAMRLKQSGVDMTTFYYPWNNHASFTRSPQYAVDHGLGIGRFLENVAYQ